MLNNKNSKIILKLNKGFLLKDYKMLEICQKKDLRMQEINIKVNKISRQINQYKNKK